MPSNKNTAITPLHETAPILEALTPAPDVDKYSPTFTANRFKPGQTGNPGGRKRYDNEIRKMLADGSKDSVRTLCEIVNDKNVNPKVRCFAAQIILDRVYGKATQPIDAIVGGSGGPLVIEFKGILDEWAK